ncbi:rod-binding protein [Neorhizobium lilium]|uniref:Rod-binding protein n=1 Tax=Neorhizobium lilium TaxID=2503024 RepID=A0A3S3RIL1_9HYPH|nr:rod-binding protein [Neorhizobium lilium]RWX77033.1 rod-binding protein [Neorhizobium lilium]
MAISPPSDLVLDVVQAADPGLLQAARDKLKANEAANQSVLLASNGVGFSQAVSNTDKAAFPDVANVRVSHHKDIPETYRKFEASVASTFIQNMLPSDSEEVYGKGAAGNFWKGMMAEQIADAVSKQGGFGIAEKLFSQSVQHARGQTPNATTDENDRQLAVSMITDFQRQVLSPAQTDTNAKKTNS